MRKGPFQRWAVTAWAAAVVALCVASAVALHGTGEEAVRAVVRGSAKIGVLLFSAAFAASSLRRAWPSGPTAWLLRNRRYVGVGFAVAHFTHLAALIVLGRRSEAFVRELDAVTLAGGGAAYLLLAAMTITSFDRTAAWLGARRWNRLHLVGSYWIWLLFVQSYAPRVFVEGPHYAPFALVPLGAFALRMWARFSRRAGDAPPAAQASPG